MTTTAFLKIYEQGKMCRQTMIISMRSMTGWFFLRYVVLVFLYCESALRCAISPAHIGSALEAVVLMFLKTFTHAVCNFFTASFVFRCYYPMNGCGMTQRTDDELDWKINHNYIEVDGWVGQPRLAGARA